MIECTQAQEQLLAGSGLVHELPEDTQAHIRTCDVCRDFAVKRRRLRRLAKSTQELVKKEFDLTPSAWARIRNTVEEEMKPEPMFSVFLRWFPVAALPVLVIALGWLLLNQQPGTSSVTVSEGLKDGLAQVDRPVAPRVSKSKGSFEVLGQDAGASIESGDKASIATLNQGHTLEFEPRSKVGIVELSDKRVALRLEAGQITCEVRKLRSQESFEVFANGMRVSVVGTRFTVTMNADGKPSVSVTEGKVSVAREGHEPALLGPGEALTGSGDDEEQPAGDDDTVKDQEGPIAGTDVSGVPVMKKSAKTVAPKRVRKKAGSLKPKAKVAAADIADNSASQDPSGRPLGADAEKVIEVTVTERMEPTAELDQSGIRDRLVGVVGMIRSGNCSAAQSALTRINLMDGASRHRGDITYLSGYCHRKQGNVGRAERLFKLYEKLAGKRRWKVPTAHDEVLPIPSPSHLQR